MKRVNQSLPLIAAVLLATTAQPALSQVNGLRVEEDGEEIAAVFGAVVTGEIAVGHEETSGTLEVIFVNEDTSDYVPAPDDSLTWLIADTMIATSDPIGAPNPFTFSVTGVEGGMTTITFTLRNDGVVYTSPAVELHVEEHVEADGLVITHRGVEIVNVWQGFVTGGVNVPNGGSTDSLFIEMLAPDSAKFVPELALGFEMRLMNVNGAVATVDSLEHFVFRANGVSLGATSVEIGVFHIDHVDFLSPPIPIDVLDPGVTGTGLAGALPARLELSGAFPNPAGSGTTVRFALPADSRVDVSVFDVRGRRVATLVREILPAGFHAAEWRAGSTTPGVYFVRLWTSQGQRAAKVVVSR
jgi:hypothetical protein